MSTDTTHFDNYKLQIDKDIEEFKKETFSPYFKGLVKPRDEEDRIFSFKSSGSLTLDDNKCKQIVIN